MKTVDGLKLSGHHSYVITTDTEHGVMNVAKHGNQRKKKQIWLKLSGVKIANSVKAGFPE